MKYLLLLAILLTGCSGPRRQKTRVFEFGDKVISCKKWEGKGCGVDLYECEDDSTYWCVTNVKTYELLY